MALVLRGAGNSATLTNWTCRQVRQGRDLGPRGGIVGRRGAVVQARGHPAGPQQLPLQGLLVGTSGATLSTLWDAMAELLHSGTLVLENSNTDRWCEVQVESVSRTTAPPNIYDVTLGLLVTDGIWVDDPDGAPNTTAATITNDGSATPVRYVNVTYAGSAACWPRIHVELNSGGTDWNNPEVEWRGRNLFPNSSLEDGADFPTGWTKNATPGINQHFGRSGSRSIKISRSGGTYNWLQFGVSSTTSMAVDASTEYTVSVYARTDSGTNDLRTRVYYWTVAGLACGPTSTEQSNTSITLPTWTRFSASFTMPADCAYCRVQFFCNTNNGAIDLDDAQMEKGSAATQFVNTSLPRYKHRSITRSSDLDTAGNETDWLIDAKLGRYRRHEGGTWVEDGDNCNGVLFDLLPGLNHLYVHAPDTGSLAVTVEHRDEYA